METVSADEQVEASLTPVPQLHIDAIALLPSGHDLVPKHIGHELRTGREEDPREIVPEELVVMLVADGHASEMGSTGAPWIATSAIGFSLNLRERYVGLSRLLVCHQVP